MAVLDWMMPGMDGVEVCRAVRKRSEAPYIYIIFLTAKGQKSEIVEGLEAGPDDYLLQIPCLNHDEASHIIKPTDKDQFKCDYGPQCINK